MKFLFIFVLLVALTVNFLDAAPYEGPYEKPRNCTLNNGQGQRLLYYLYTNATRNNPENITIFRNIRSSRFSPNRKTIILVHGWHNDIDSDMIQVVKDGYLNLGDYNVVGVDWGFKARSFYPTSAACTVVVAQWIDVDIYPNYGGNQPGCTNGFQRFFGACAHGKSYEYFAKSLTANIETASMAIECVGGSEDIKNNNCIFGPSRFYYMGDPESRMAFSKTKQNTSLGVFIFNMRKEDISTLASFEFNFLVFVFIGLIIVLIGLTGYCIFITTRFGLRKAGYQCVKVPKSTTSEENGESERTEEENEPLNDDLTRNRTTI
uniref:CSON008654 protein n=1 Tax=Culicoides sonorensis TaxID=179676 RepID=A0A336MB67_CULSO